MQMNANRAIGVTNATVFANGTHPSVFSENVAGL